MAGRFYHRSFSENVLQVGAVFVLFVFNFFHLSALNINVTLSGGPGLYAGRVEVNYNGTWGSLCDTGLNIDVGHVICRQLGYPRAIATPCCNAFGSGSSSFWLSGVECNGNESSLGECGYKTWAEKICNNGLDVASVVCENPNISDSKFMTKQLRSNALRQKLFNFLLALTSGP